MKKKREQRFAFLERSVAFADTSAIYYFLRMANLEQPETGGGASSKPTYKQTRRGRFAGDSRAQHIHLGGRVTPSCRLPDAE